MKRITFETLYRWQYPIIMLLSLIYAYFGRSASSSFMVPLLMMLWALYGFSSFNKAGNSQFKVIFTILLLYVFLSIFEYLINGLPMVLYYNDFRGIIIPMLLVYVGMVNKDEKIYKWLVLSSVFCVLIGLYLYFVQPSWYISFKFNVLSDTWAYEESNMTEDNVMLWSRSGRFSSFFSTAYYMSYYATFSLCIVLYDMNKDKEHQMFKKNWVLVSILVILLLGAFLTLTRVAIIYIILLLIYYYIFGNTNGKSSRFIIRGAFFVLVALVFLTFASLASSDFGGVLIERVGERLTLESASEMVEGSRSIQIHRVLDAWNNIILGDGMGSRGGAARIMNLPGVTDNNWVRILVEYGIVGTIGYILVLGMSLKKAFQKRSYLMAELTIVLYGILSMFVADTLTKGHSMIIFWFALGRIWNKRLLKVRMAANDGI